MMMVLMMMMMDDGDEGPSNMRSEEIFNTVYKNELQLMSGEE